MSATRWDWAWAAGWGFVLTIAQIAFVCIVGDAPPAHGLAFSPDGKWLAALGEDWAVRVWTRDGDPTPREIPPGVAEPVALVFRQDDTLWTAQSDMGRTAWDPATGIRQTRDRGHTGGVHRQAFSPDGWTLASCATDAIHVQDLAADRRFVVPTTGTVRALAFNPDGTQLAFVDDRPGAVIGNLAEQTIRVIRISDRVDALAFGPRDLALAVGDQIRVVDSGTDEERARWDCGRGAITVLAYRADGQGLAAGRADGRVTIWRPSDGRQMHNLAAHTGAVRDVAFSPDGHRLATNGADRRVMLWDADTGAEIAGLRSAERPAWLAFLADAYRRLYRWDVYWYSGIAANGYRSDAISADGEASNVAFFPGQALYTRLIHRTLGIPAPLAAVLGSQLAAWGFWTYVFGFFRRWGMPTGHALAAALVIFVHPAAFFLVSGYAESLFLLALVGFLYWERQPGVLAWVLAACHGYVMTGTRLVGLPLAGIPVFRVLLERWRGERVSSSRWLASAGLAALTAAGALSFFAFCAWRFGRWDLYFATEKEGWSIVADYLAPLRWQLYWPAEGGLHLNRLSVLLLLAFAIVLALRERQYYRDPGYGAEERRWFYLAAGIMFYVSVCGFYSKDLDSMIRYSLPIYVMLVLAGIHMLSRGEPLSLRRHWLAWLLMLFTAAASLQLQARLLRQFTEGHWIA